MVQQWPTFDHTMFIFFLLFGSPSNFIDFLNIPFTAMSWIQSAFSDLSTSFSPNLMQLLRLRLRVLHPRHRVLLSGSTNERSEFAPFSTIGVL